MRLGILGGTFDPIHYAHLFIAEQARVEYALDRVLFVPNRLPAHKEAEGVAAAEHRYEMARLAVADNAAFECSRVELDREDTSYTVETLRILQAEHPGAELFFITGTDTVAEMPTWHLPEEILRLCTLITAERPGCTFDDLRRTLPAAYTERMLPLPAVHLFVSATEIRDHVRRGGSIRYLTPQPVADYIERHRLYR